MSEAFYWQVTDDINSTIRTISFPENTLMILERVPDRWLSDIEIENGLIFSSFQLDHDFNNWECGRIFNESFELYWQKQDSRFHAVYIGEKVELSGFYEDDSFDIRQIESKDIAYYLWGRKLPDGIDLVGKSEEDILFGELQIPRLLDYPIENNIDKESRVKLIVRHYLYNSTLKFYRFVKLEAVK